MGIFSDLRRLKKVSKEVSKDFDPVAQMQAASAQMQQMTKQSQIATSGVPAVATVNAVRDTGTEVNMQPVTVVDVTILPTGSAPVLASMTLLGHAALTGVSVGSQVNVKYDPADPGTAVLV